jgi:hypothetical protein
LPIQSGNQGEAMNLASGARSAFARAVAAFAVAFASSTAHAQAPQRFTPDKPLRFDIGTPKARAMLSSTPEVRGLVAAAFGIAAADLNDDGSGEIILVGRSNDFCGSGGCQLVVLEKQGPGKIAAILSMYVGSEDLALTREKVNGYRAVVQLDGKGGVAMGDRKGTPLYRKPMVYPVQAGAGKAPAAGVADAVAATGAAAAKPGAPGPWNEVQVISQATGGRMKAKSGTYFEKDCNEKTDYSAEVTDLNGDGQPEVFVNVSGTCMGGRVGVHLSLYIKNAAGQWKQQFGFPGMHSVLKTKNKGYPDIEIGGPGACQPVWRWNGQQYAILKKCR